MTEIVEIREKDLATLLDIISHDLELLEDIPGMVDQNHDAEISKNVGKILEINYSRIDKLKRKYSFIRKHQSPDTELQKLEKEFL